MTGQNDSGRAAAWSRQESPPLSTSPPSPCTFSVRVEFDERVGDEDLLADLSGSPRHRLFDFLPQISTNSAGRAEIELTIPGTDLWTSILTAMSVIRQSGYDPAAVHVTSGRTVQERVEAA